MNQFDKEQQANYYFLEAIDMLEEKLLDYNFNELIDKIHIYKIKCIELINTDMYSSDEGTCPYHLYSFIKIPTFLLDDEKHDCEEHSEDYVDYCEDCFPSFGFIMYMKNKGIVLDFNYPMKSIANELQSKNKTINFENLGNYDYNKDIREMMNILREKKKQLLKNIGRNKKCISCKVMPKAKLSDNCEYCNKKSWK